MEWGGGRVAFENPAPEPPPDSVRAPEAAPEIPLPQGPLLYAVRFTGPARVEVVPAARLPSGGGALLPLELPPEWTDDYRTRFDSTFLAPGTELALQRHGRRIGSVVLERERRIARPNCPAVAAGVPFLIPGQPATGIAPAVEPTLSRAAPRSAPELAPVRGMVLAAPVLAERLIGGERAYLARRASLRAVPLPGDSAPAMAATYLVSDSLAPGPPQGDAISLFFLAAYAPARGYSTIWSELRRYDAPEEKEAFEYLDWIAVSGGRIHLLRRFDGSGEGLAGRFVAEGDEESEGGVDWHEAGRCRSLELLGDAGAG